MLSELVYTILFCNKGQECFEEGKCMDSLMLDLLHNVEDLQDCLDACQGDPGCEYFTFFEEENSCLMLANCLHFSVDSCNDCYSGSSTCEGTGASIHFATLFKNDCSLMTQIF